MSALLERIAAIVGPQALLTADADTAPYAIDWRRRYRGRPLAVVRPASTAEVAAVVRLCAETRTPVVPQGGNTGLVGGATPDASGREVVVSLARMNRIRAIDRENDALTAEAGCTLAAVQAAAREAGRLFPLSLASEGSCQIGGNLSSNAGGTAVLRYGNARELTLGLEVVLPDGAVWDGLRALRKDNTGYDLKQLFLGAEGTLGIITAAVLELFPLPAGRATAIAALDTPAQAVELLGLMKARCGERLTAFELFSDYALALVLKHFPGSAAPFTARHPQYALVELEDTQSEEAARGLAEAALAEALQCGVVRDAVLAASEAQSRALWSLRENMSEAQAAEGKNIKHDVSVPTSRIAAFVAATDAALARAFPGVRMVTFGHLGDGNLHYNAAAPEGVDPERWMANQAAVNRIVHDSVAAFGGSISAEHGLGQAKREEILRYKSPVEMDLMRRVKAALDPLGIMNPGKVI
ncbi:MAG: FAD-binding oxidoreductase [Burkholderiales bacterium]|nr:FAD-binding oxidoreductase [Burkholderiales bacterium]